jgi:hypothetical protein
VLASKEVGVQKRKNQKSKEQKAKRARKEKKETPLAISCRKRAISMNI